MSKASHNLRRIAPARSLRRRLAATSLPPGNLDTRILLAGQVGPDDVLAVRPERNAFLFAFCEHLGYDAAVPFLTVSGGGSSEEFARVTLNSTAAFDDTARPSAAFGAL